MPRLRRRRSTLPQVDDIQTYVVNLRRRPDRRTWMETLLPEELRAEYTSDWNVPMDGHLLTHELLDAHDYKLFDWQIPSMNPWWSRPLKWGEIGCAIAHLACWRRAVNYSQKYHLILEDDVCFGPDVVDRLLDRLVQFEDAGADFDLLYLGRVPLEPDQPYMPGFVQPGYSHCTYGYLLTLPGLRRLLDADLGSAIAPVDEFIPAMYVDHPRPDVQARFPRQLRALAFEQPLVTQLPKKLAGSDTECSAFAAESRH